MISLSAEGRFAAEFLAFLATVAGLALVALKPELLNARSLARLLLAGGFTGVAVVSLLQGSLLIGDHAQPVTLVVRAVAVLAIVGGSAGWAGGPQSQRLLWFGCGAMVLGVALLGFGVEVGADGALALGGAGIALALRVASDRSISARVAASSAAILLAVVLVLAGSLSAVISNTVRADAGRRLDARAALEADFTQTTQPTLASVVARNVALIFATNDVYQNAVKSLVDGPAPNTGGLTGTALANFNEIQTYLAGGMALSFINKDRHEYGRSSPSGFDERMVDAAIGSAAVKQAFAQPAQGQRASVDTFGSTAFVVAVQPVAELRPDGSETFPTAIVAVSPLDSGYLSVRRRVDTNVSLALMSRTDILAKAGDAGSKPELIRLAQDTFNTGQPIPLVSAEGKLFSARPLLAGDNPTAVLVAATPATVVTTVRDKLLRTLFLLAMAGTVLALALAAFAGERLSSGIRTLTAAARRIQEGNFEPSGVTAADEIGVLGASFDSMANAISEQTTALQQAAEDEAALRGQLEAVVAGMGEALVAVDQNGRITLFNRAAEELLGRATGAVTGKPVAEVVVAVGEDGDKVPQLRQRPSPTRWSAMASVGTVAGSVPIEITATPLRGPEGTVSGGVLILRDRRQELAVDRVKSDFLSRIGHELRTPLTGILGYAEILLHREVPPARARDMHEQIADAGRRLYRIVQMLEFSAAAEAGRSLLRTEAVDVRKVVDGVVAEWGAKPNANHALTRRVARRLPRLRGDRRWLTMAVEELVDNAVKFSPDGGKVSVVAAVREASNGDGRSAVEVSVIDQGVGLTPEEMDRVFSDFVQADESDTRRFGGLGLGLSMVKRVAEAHGGAVQVESTPQKGSKFSILIPVLPNDDV